MVLPFVLRVGHSSDYRKLFALAIHVAHEYTVRSLLPNETKRYANRFRYSEVVIDIWRELRMKRRISGFLIACVGLLMVLAPAVSAQQIGSAVPGSITVVGEGTARMPAEQAQVVITIGTD